MQAPAFWWRPERSIAAQLLEPVAAVVGAVAAQRMRRPPAWRAPVPVICVGNPTVGGAGKTPLALALAARLTEHDARPVFLTRGYGGRLAGPVLVADHGPDDVGDEALLLAAVAPTVVSRDRAAGGRLAATRGTVIVMDDGFQNPSLAKDLALLVLDATVGLGNGRVTPAGPLRAPFAAQAALAHGLVRVTGSEPAHASLPGTDLPVWDARLVPSVPTDLQAVPVLAFAGIGRPEKFFASVSALGAAVGATVPFPDHHPYGEADARALLARADREGLRPVTTRKDLVRLHGRPGALGALAAASIPVDVTAELDPALVARAASLMSRHEIDSR